MKSEVQGNYAEVNGLTMYYEVHGAGQPLVLLHGAFGVVEGWVGVLPTLTQTHQVILVELQGHGRTGDIDRPLSFGPMADDVAALLRQLKLEPADVFGYSMGGRVALALAIRHPDLVRKLAILGTTAGTPKDTYEPETYQQLMSITPETFNFPQVKDPYTSVAPDPSQWPVLVSKIVQANIDSQGFPAQDLQSIQSPTLIMQGDHEGVRPEHAVEMYRNIPRAQLAIFPNGDHFLLFMSPEKVLAVLIPFLEAPL